MINVRARAHGARKVKGGAFLVREGEDVPAVEACVLAAVGG